MRNQTRVVIKGTLLELSGHQNTYMPGSRQTLQASPEVVRIGIGITLLIYNEIKMENQLVNFSFGTLLLIMVGSWSSLAFISRPLGKKWENFLGISLSLALLALTGSLGSRWLEAGHFPLSNLYESLIFLGWCLTGLQLWVVKLKSGSPLMVAILSPLAMLVTAFASLTLPPEMQEAAPLVPALRSNWLMMHVTVMMCSYATLLAGSLMAVTFLVLTGGQSIALEGDSFGGGEVSQNTIPSTALARQLDNLSYRTLGMGFPLLTIGIISGAVWANEAWGSYWSWDPKETWALITWVVYAIYLHTRITRGWSGKGPALVATLGFVVVWICYLGVNLLGEGLHSYGWFVGGTGS
uniref:Cytochrome c biogenesis protein CcsA n=1 Tax=Nephroselmis pyriformis TaxID=156128 RepID=A0A8A2H8A0_9CHLO|nr:protein involved in cytochrome c biogenesis [Nephroselmis pyriformis]QSV37312.1 protein involved in cytochrome c biogenesis [Nephroselmis pyriformis]